MPGPALGTMFTMAYLLLKATLLLFYKWEN